MTDSKLIEQQVELEREGLGLGIARYRKVAEERLEDTRPGQALLNTSLSKYMDAIKGWLAAVDRGEARRHSGVAHFLKQFRVETVAYAAARHLIHRLPLRENLQSAALTITGILEDTLNHELLQTMDPGKYRLLQRKIEDNKHEGYRHVTLVRQMKFAGLKRIVWGHSERMRLGVVLVELFQEATGMIEVALEGNSTEQMYKVVPTEATLDWLQKSHARCELMHPVFMPMVCPPQPWTTPFDGGYVTLRRPMVNGAPKGFLAELRDYEGMGDVYRSLNAIQATPWSINQGVLRVLQEAWDKNLVIGKLVSRELQAIPEKTFRTVADGDIHPEDEEVFKAWKKSAAQAYDARSRQTSQRLQVIQKLSLAHRFAEYDRIWFPHHTDWRGRVYPITVGLTPQGDDVAKALLQFADGKPLGEHGAYWLAVHGANCAGVDKVSFDERVAWVEEHSAEIIACALNPFAAGALWTRKDDSGKLVIDKPWQFLAFCFEWSGFAMQGEQYVSRLPVSLDGSCNGLQNFAAMLRDEEGGAATNLIPSERPSDIYSLVAAKAEKLVERDALDGDELAALWVGKISRKIAKRPAMTLSYGATMAGFRDQTLDTLATLNQEMGAPYLGPDADEWKAAMYMAKALKDAISQTVKSAVVAMEWLQAVAKLLAEDKLPVCWTAPSGFIVRQDYKKMEGQRFECNISGRRIRLTVNVAGKQVDSRRAALGVSPNFIHSCDAAHLVRTVTYCLDRGITQFAMVHDSFGTLAADVDALSVELRRAFVDQYSFPVLEQFLEDVKMQLSPELHDRLPPLPQQGNLDLEGVLSSEYFFA